MSNSLLPPENLFAALPAELSRGLFEKARSIELAVDQMLFLAGDAGDACYRVEDGLLKASVFAPEGGERILAIFGPNSVVGELSMIDGMPRSASVAALRPSKLSLISRAGFDAFARSNPELCRHVTRLLARRLRETNLADPARAVENYVAALGGDPDHAAAAKSSLRFLDDPDHRVEAASVLEPILLLRTNKKHQFQLVKLV